MNELDKFPLLVIFTALVLAQLVFIELGYRFGARTGVKNSKAQMAQVRAIMGASLGLLAFVLAFSFNMAQQHFEERTRAYLLEVSAVDSAFRGAGLIPAGESREAKELLVRFARVRSETGQAARVQDMESVVELIRESERMHDQLWAIAERAMDMGEAGSDPGIFAQSVLAMINAHDERLQTIFFNRVAPIIWLTLVGLAMLSMAITGYQAGLTGTRSSFATWTLAVSFAFVMMLITDLDRPVMTLFKQNPQLMVELQNRMEGGDYWDPSVHRGE